MGNRLILRTTSVESIAHARAWGFEDIEPEIASLMQFDTETLDRFREVVRHHGFSCRIFEAPLPKEVQVTERGFNIFSWTEYLKKALERAATMGCTMIAWADGPSRMLPVEGDTSVQKEHFSQFLFMLCDVASRFGMTVCIEPASPRVSNFLTTPAEVAEIITSVGQQNLAMLLSSAYVAQTALNMDELVPHAALLRHVHLEHPHTRRMPIPPTLEDGFDYRTFLKALEVQCSYTGPLALPSRTEPRFLANLIIPGAWHTR
ncbi:MAG: TIM barrel protein [Spirochaetales bacterium]|nr:TIM barrel protein [Spirochaetales bacterium]